MTQKTVYVNGYEFSVNTETGTTTARGKLQNEAAENKGKTQAKAAEWEVEWRKSKCLNLCREYRL